MARDRNGSTLVTIMIVMTVIGISLSLYLRSQTDSIFSFVREKLKLQAIANARSALLYGQHQMNRRDEPDTSAINGSLFEDENQWQLWEDSLFGTGQFERNATPSVQEIVTTGTKNGEHYGVSVKYSSVCTVGDTTLILIGTSVLEAASVTGTKITVDSDTSRGSLPINAKGLSEAKTWLEDLFREDAAVTPDGPVTVQDEKEFRELGDTVAGDLFLDGSVGKLSLTGVEKSITVLGDLQITGEVELRGFTFVVSGEIRYNDRTSCVDCRAISKGKQFLDGETLFSGEIFALDLIEIFNSAHVTDGSVVSFAGKAGKESEEKKKAAISVRDLAQVEGVLLSLGSSGIMTEPDTKTTGILWSKNWIRHRGLHKGLLRAVYYDGEPGTEAPQEVDPAGNKNAGLKQPKQQIILGRVEPPFDPKVYYLPWYMGEPVITSWREFNR